MLRLRVLLVAIAPLAAFGQAPGDKPAETFREVERGIFLGASAGPFFIFNPPATDPAQRKLSPGQNGTLEVGIDLGELASLSVFAMVTANRADSSYTGTSGGSYSGDFSSLVPGASVRVNLLGLADANQTRRTFFYLRGGAGYAIFSPSKLLGPDLLVFAGPGVEYYTRLRHFSIGVEVTGTVLVGSLAFGVAVTPSLRYAF